MPETPPETVWSKEAVEKLAAQLQEAWADPAWDDQAWEIKDGYRQKARDHLDALSEHLVPAAVLEEAEKKRDEQSEWADRYQLAHAREQKRVEQAEAKLEEIWAAAGKSGWEAADVGRIRQILASTPTQQEDCDCDPDGHVAADCEAKGCREARCQPQQVEERVRELRDALEPFAAEADWAADMLCEPERLLRPDMAITVAHLQAAKAALEPPIVCRDCGTTAPRDRTGWTFEMGGPWRCPTCSAAFETKEEPR